VGHQVLEVERERGRSVLTYNTVLFFHKERNA